jgi:transcriptional regulator with XRE-family HTH domain
MLRRWRQARAASQHELALACGVSQRHISFLETGRSRPSRGMVLHLGSVLSVPLERQNAMLLAAGFAPVYQRRPLDASEMDPVSRAIDALLEGQEPYPAIVVDAAYRILRANAALGRLLGFLLGFDAVAAAPDAPLNAAEMVMRPDGLRPVIENWAEVATWLIRRLRAEAMLEERDGRLGPLLERLLAYPDVAGFESAGQPEAELPPTLALRFRKGDSRLALFSVIATVGTPLDVSLQDVRVELFFPADEGTRAWFAGA